MTMWHLGVEDELRALLSIPASVALSACITVGRPAGRHGSLRRKPLIDVTYDDGWGGTPDWIV
jgi:hypothetical protein